MFLAYELLGVILGLMFYYCFIYFEFTSLGFKVNRLNVVVAILQHFFMGKLVKTRPVSQWQKFKTPFFQLKNFSSALDSSHAEVH